VGCKIESFSKRNRVVLKENDSISQVTAIARIFAVIFSRREQKRGHFFVSVYKSVSYADSGLRHDRKSRCRPLANMVEIKDKTAKHRPAAVCVGLLKRREFDFSFSRQSPLEYLGRAPLIAFPSRTTAQTPADTSFDDARAHMRAAAEEWPTILHGAARLSLARSLTR
jgi:hypothetical protein